MATITVDFGKNRGTVRPMHATAHRLAAVVSPLILFPSLIIVPAPRNPIPLITWAPRRKASRE